MVLVSRFPVAFLLLAASLAAQVVYIDNNSPTTGTSNGFPWGQANGFTTLHVYTAAQLTAGGVAPGSILTGIAVAPSSGTSGIYNAPQARFTVGHLATNPPLAGAWESNIASPSVIHDLTSGAYTFPWTLGTWTPLPGVASAGFLWDGVTDIALFYTSSAGTTGTFSARRTATNLRHSLAVFNATNQAPTSNGLFAMKVELTFQPGVVNYQVNQPESTFNIDGVVGNGAVPASVVRGTGVGFTANFQSTNVGLGWDLAYTLPDPLVALGAGGLPLPLSGQILNLNLASPGFSALNALTFPPFPGNFSIPLSLPVPLTMAAQMVVLSPSNPDGLALSGGTNLTIM